MQYLDQNETTLLEKGALYTAKEIAGQPALWQQTLSLFEESAEHLAPFLAQAYSAVSQIILTGAGTSAFVGLSLQGVFLRNTGVLSRAVATTDIVSHPQDYFNAQQATLVISFARSGSSPESCAALELADRFAKKCFHLIITCDAGGALAGYTSKNPVFVFLLPEEANDKSLAMTGSYSSMLLAGLLTAYIKQKEFCRQQVELVASAAGFILENHLALFEAISAKEFERAVFLGSGAMLGSATEAALKLQELTDGAVICKADSFLGFRHGPRAVINEKTLVFYFFSSTEYVQRYEEDMLADMSNGNALLQVGLQRTAHRDKTDITIAMGAGSDEIAEDFLPVCAILPAQLIGFYKSLQLGCMPDSPSADGAISRVVKGVHIYPVNL